MTRNRRGLVTAGIANGAAPGLATGLNLAFTGGPGSSTGAGAGAGTSSDTSGFPANNGHYQSAFWVAGQRLHDGLGGPGDDGPV